MLMLRQNLRSAEEMEEEEREAQSAKLQELIRRGGPQDLQEANKLMKVMAGYDTRNKTDYRAKAAEEVGRIQQKARILEEMLQDFKQGDKMAEGDVFEVRTFKRGVGGERVSDRTFRNLPVPFQAPSQKSRRCAKRSPRTTRQLRSYSKSMTAYIEQQRDTSSSKREISKARTRFREVHLAAVVLE
jgi:hypothetical protein